MDKTTIIQNVVARYRLATQPAEQTAAPQAMEQTAVAPPGWEGTVKHMKKHKEIDNPWALAWYMKDKGAEPHHASDANFILAAHDAMKRYVANKNRK